MPLYGAGSGQPLDSDLTAIAALSTTAYGRALLELANAGAGRTALELGTAATHAHGDYEVAGAAAAAAAASQPVDSDLTALAALATTAFGRGLLELADQAALLSAAAAAASGHNHDATYQPLLQRGYVVGQYYPAFIGAVSGAGAGAPTKDQLLMTPFAVYKSQPFDRIATYITANGTATCVDRLGIYNDNAGVPGTVLLDAGTVATDAGAAAIKAITISITLAPGVYWSAVCPQVAAPGNHNRYIPTAVGGYLNAPFTGQVFGPGGITGALPDNPTLGAAVAINPSVIALRAA